MEYNTSLPHLVLPEYGRNIQKMIDFAITVKDRDERNKVAQSIINVMGQLNPHLRDVTDFKHKLWDHIFIISDFNLDVDSPYPKPTKESFQTKPNKVPYASNKIRFKHYGKTVELLIAKAIDFDEGEEKSVLIEQIANLMKRSYLAWNRDSVTDDVIFRQLEQISDGKLKIPAGIILKSVQNLSSRPTNSGRDNRNDKRKSNNGRQNNNYRKDNSKYRKKY